MNDAVLDGLKQSLSVEVGSHQINGIQRRHQALERFLKKSVAGKFPDLAPISEVVLKEHVQLLGCGALFRFRHEIPELCDLFPAYFLSGQRERQRLDFNSDLKDLLRIFVRETRDLSPGKRRALNETLMLELDQRFPDESLPHAELLRQLA